MNKTKKIKYIQFSLTVSESKRLIAYAVSQMKSVRHAMKNGKVIFKGGTTVSCAAEILVGTPLRICGRISQRGAVSSKVREGAAHSLLYSQGQITNIDEDYDDRIMEMGPEDVIITGANIIDIHGNAAMLAGSPAGNRCGKGVSAMTVEGAKVIVAAGIEKLIPGSVYDSVKCAQRKGIDSSRGMACGLFPVVGELVTELEAIQEISNVNAVLIGKGGIAGGEGSCLFQAWGTEPEIKRLEDILDQCYGKDISGTAESLTECSFPCAGCREHLSCSYKQAKQSISPFIQTQC